MLSVLPGKRNYSRINYEVTFIKKYKDKSKKKERLSYQNAVFHQKRWQTIDSDFGRLQVNKN